VPLGLPAQLCVLRQLWLGGNTLATKGRPVDQNQNMPGK
jgi:hypothetical protein